MKGKKPSAKSAKKNVGKSEFGLAAFRGFNAEAAVKNMMSRTDFLRFTGISAAALGAATAGLSGIAKAQEPPPPPPSQETVFKTLAAVVDTIIPGDYSQLEMPPLPPGAVPIFDANMTPLWYLTTLGTTDTATPGAAFIPPYIGSYNGKYYMLAVPPVYISLYEFIPAFSGIPSETIVTILDMYDFKSLPYPIRKEIFDGMRVNPDSAPLVSLLCQLTALLYCSEIHNLSYKYEIQSMGVVDGNGFPVPKYVDPETGAVPPLLDNLGMPIYERLSNNKWPILPFTAWDLMGYPGPLKQDTDYISPYPDLDVMIKQGRVIFGGN